jgi:hypothetical protein
VTSKTVSAATISRQLSAKGFQKSVSTGDGSGTCTRGFIVHQNGPGKAEVCVRPQERPDLVAQVDRHAAELRKIGYAVALERKNYTGAPLIIRVSRPTAPTEQETTTVPAPKPPINSRTEDDIRAELDRPGAAHFSRPEIRALLDELDRLRSDGRPTCDATSNAPGNILFGPCILRHQHDGPGHQDAQGRTWQFIPHPMAAPTPFDKTATAIDFLTDAASTEYRTALYECRTALKHATDAAGSNPAALDRIDMHSLTTLARYAAELLRHGGTLAALAQLGDIHKEN